MFIYRSNRAEELARRLAEVARRPLASPFVPEVVVVSSQGMERWLAQELARHLGVWANARFPFPRAFVDELLGASGTAPASFTRDRLTWAVGSLLPEIARNPSARAIAAYLEDDASDLALFQLSRQIANVFDQYAVYRPELVRAWARGEGRGWQPDLFRAVLARVGPEHVGTRAERFLAEGVPESAPERVSVFGVSALPRVYLRILAKLAASREVHLFLLSPSPNERGSAHPLTRSLGALGLEFEGLLRAESPEPRVIDCFVTPGSKTMLEVVQSDLLSGHGRHPSAKDHPRAVARQTDDTIAIHSCHGPLREVEVLRNQLLAAFDADPTLEPQDVVVMAPDIDAYAPLVDAVFGGTPDGPGRIPYRIADRRVATASTAVDSVLRLFDLAGGRMKASDVLDFLQLGPVRERFGFSPEDLPELRRLVRDAGIRWGVDAGHRAREGQLEQNENTWRFGLDRLLVGRALPPSAELLAPLHGVVPPALATSVDGELVGRLAECCRSLFDWHAKLAEPRTAHEWCQAVSGLLETFVGDDEAALPFVRTIRDAARALARSAGESGFSREVDRDAYASLLRDALEGNRTSRNFVSGGVTFCALLPMRSVPFRVVCVLGLTDADFPRKDRAPAFDLMALHPRPGDRSARAEDRQLFLEALLSARSRLLLFYTGRTIHENAVMPPSVVVSELTDALDASFAFTRETPGQLRLVFDAPHVAKDGPGARVTVEHPLQPFSQRYFESHDARLVSYVAADAEGARALARGVLSKRRFHESPLFTKTEAEANLDELARFFENPARGLLRRSLGIALEDEPTIVSDKDPIVLSPLSAYEIGADLFARRLSGKSPEDVAGWVRASGALPFGTPGDVELSEVLADVTAVSERASRWLVGGRREPFPVRLRLGNRVLDGLLRDVYGRAQVFARYGRSKARTDVSAWIRHLALQAAGLELPTVIIGRSIRREARVEERRFEPISSAIARELLGELLYLEGLGLQVPLCFFPSASQKFVEASLQKADRPADERERLGLEAARRVFQDSRRGPADGDDAYVRRLFEGIDPFVQDPVPFDEAGTLGMPAFCEVSRRVFEPLFSHSTVESA